MSEMVACKACGYIMAKEKLGEKCPACGVLAKMFLPYDERISAKRKFLLSLDLHPVTVHFPQAFLMTILVLSLVTRFFTTPFNSQLISTLQVLAVMLPFTVAAAMAAGIFDAKIRFRKVTAPLLKKKIGIGTILLVCTTALAALALSGMHGTPSGLIYMALLSGAGLALGIILALWGVGLLHARFPG